MRSTPSFFNPPDPFTLVPDSDDTRRLNVERILGAVEAVDSQSQQRAALGDVGSIFDEHGFDYWVFGGWAVDFHVGAVTRQHTDVDLAVWADDADTIHSVMIANGWEHEPAADEDGGTGYGLRGVRLELTYLASNEDGEVFIALRDRYVLWSESSLGDHVLELDGTCARVVPLDLLMRGKSRPRDDPEEAEIDRKDFEILSRLVS